jgi:hypothetical protein
VNLTPQGADQKYSVSFFGTIATAGAFILYLFSTTWEPADMNAFLIMTLILLAGIVLAYIFVGFKLMPFNMKNLALDLIATVVSVISLIYISNLYNPASLGVSPLNQTAFLILAGVAEEWFFRSWLCCWVYKFTRFIFLAVPVSSMVWALFHLARYGGDMGMIWIVFLAGLPLGYFTLLFKSADGPMFGHMIVNALVR